MTSYLKVATETADLIEFGVVQETSEHNHSDFERLLGIAETKKEQQRQVHEKREQALAEIEEGRKKRAELRDQMQISKHQKLLGEISQEKQDEKDKQERQTLQAQLEAALAKPQKKKKSSSFSIGRRKDTGDDNNNNDNDDVEDDDSFTSDPFYRFRAEDERVQLDKERVSGMRTQLGKSGSDLLRRFVEGSSDWSSHIADNTNKNNNNVANNNSSNNTGVVVAEEKVSSSVSSSSHKPALVQEAIAALNNSNNNNNNSGSCNNNTRVPTVARLILDGYGNDRAQLAAKSSDKANEHIHQSFEQLEKQDAADMEEWSRRRAFYNRERLSALRQMNAVTQFSSQFSSTALSYYNTNNNNKTDILSGEGEIYDSKQPTEVLGHFPEDDIPKRERHPVDHFHSAVRETVEIVHAAADPWKVVEGFPATKIVGSQRAQSSSAGKF